MKPQSKIKRILSIKSWSIGAQITGFLLLLFGILFGSQMAVTHFIFSDYFTERQLNKYKDDVNEFFTNYEDEPENTKFKLIDNFAKSNSGYTLIYDENLELKEVDTIYPKYTFEYYDTSWVSYTFITEEVTFEGFIGGTINSISYERVGEYNIARELTFEGVQYVNDTCKNTCNSFTDIEIKSVDNPDHYNHIYSQDINVKVHLEFIEQVKQNNSLEEYKVDDLYQNIISTDTYYQLFLMKQLDNGEYAVNIITVSTGKAFLQLVNRYVISAYAAALLIIIIAAILFSKIITKPIKHINIKAKEMTRLNFNEHITEYNNLETEELALSINDLSSKLENSLSNLRDNNEELKGLYNEQTKQVNLKKDFISAVSHELKTPLMVINLTINAIKDGIITGDDINSEYDNISSEIESMRSMIQDMMDIFKIESSEVNFDIDEVSILNIIDNLIENLNMLYTDKNLKIENDIKDDILIKADEKFIIRAISNLFTNAIKYTPNNNLINFNLLLEEESLILTISNYGVTIPENDINSLFEPFYKVDKSGSGQSKSKGTGLGLYIVKEILDKHDFKYGITNIDNGVQSRIIIPIKYVVK